MIDINDEIKASLTDAGIGPAYHDRQLASVPLYGEALLKLLTAKGMDIKSHRFNAVWQGIGLTEAITLFCRALHINGVGCYMRPLVRFRPIINDAEFKEIVNDIDVLVVLNAQDTNRGNPLHDAVMAELEYVLRRRHDAKKMTFFQLAIPEDKPLLELPNCYWSHEFVDLLATFERITPSLLTKAGITV